ncbi:hypothetical protein FQA45_00185 [Glutamicibacter halophytocola]|uniref:Uncharacterized protein n=1 Tax=Glutamicibacter halophytocola TaxID=1933880 RepID=A0ABX5Y422_9MICC|nr:hypothetical protein [Glutamicibacter halophytocola]QDY64854.1 hypothetical protein FQA45_00185 [Glutamicibacter halophytocola]
MAKVEGRVLIIPRGQHNHSAKLTVFWDDASKADRARQVKDVATTWGRNKYRGNSVFVDTSSIAKQGDDGAGALFVNGIEYAKVTSYVHVPKPVEVASLFDGGAQ